MITSFIIDGRDLVDVGTTNSSAPSRQRSCSRRRLEGLKIGTRMPVELARQAERPDKPD